MPILDQTVVLVGLMGAGKSRIGAELAKLLDLPFVDADKEIELAANLSISEIFEKFGEKEFRKGERQVMTRLLSGAPKVLASGGGAFIQDDIRNLIKKTAISVWLKADLHTLVNRTARTNHRPILQGVNPAEKLQQLMDVRYPIYAEANITVVTDQQTPQDMALRIQKELDRYIRQR